LRERGRLQAARASSGEALLESLERAIAELRDDHVTIAGAGKSVSRRIPYDLDIWPRWRGGVVTIEAVRTFGDADVAGLHAGQAITRIQDVPIESVVREKLGRSAGNVADIEWALRQAIAGPRTGIQRLEVRDANRVAVVPVERTKPAPTTAPAFLARRMGMSERDIGYIRVRVGVAEDLAGQFAGGLVHLGPTRALIMDLRESAGPGDRRTTLAILSRFASAPSPWQVRQPRGGQGSQTPYCFRDAIRRTGRGARRSVTAGKAKRSPRIGGSGARADRRHPDVGPARRGSRTRTAQRPRAAVSRRACVHGGRPPARGDRPAIPVDLAAPAGGPGT
jgi:hypothetical protein